MKYLVGFLLATVIGLSWLSFYFYKQIKCKTETSSLSPLKEYEDAYIDRTTRLEKEEFVKRPVNYDHLKKMHSGCNRDTAFGNHLRSVWVDDITIVHLAYFILMHKCDKADGIRIYTEKYDTELANTPSGESCKENTISLALMVTKKNQTKTAGAPMHLDWLIANTEDSNRFALDNYNDPCPAGTNCGSLDN